MKAGLHLWETATHSTALISMFHLPASLSTHCLISACTMKKERQEVKKTAVMMIYDRNLFNLFELHAGIHLPISKKDKEKGITTWYRFCSQSINGRRASAALLTRSGLKSYTQKALNIMATKSNGGNPAWSKLKSTSKYNRTFTYNLQKGVTAVLNEGTGSKSLPENFHQDP